MGNGIDMLAGEAWLPLPGFERGMKCSFSWAVGGLTTAEIAKAFLVPEATMAQRISGAKQSIKDSGILFQLPTKVRSGG